MDAEPDESAAMPMCPCPDCRQPISTSARACVFCGADAGAYDAQALRITLRASLVAGVVSLFGLYVLASAVSDLNPAPARTRHWPVSQAALDDVRETPAAPRVEAAVAREPWIVIAPAARDVTASRAN